MPTARVLDGMASSRARVGRGVRLASAVIRTAALAATLAAAAAPRPVAAEVRLPPPGDRSVHDLASVVRPEDAATMERRHQALFEATGVAIAVVTVPDLEGEPIEDFATRAGTEWGVGRKGEDRGIVVVLSLSPRRIFVATGYGVEGFLPDGRVGGILDREVTPLLRQGDMSRGLLQASAALVAAAAQEYGVDIEGLKATRASGRSQSRKAPPI